MVPCLSGSLDSARNNQFENTTLSAIYARTGMMTEDSDSEEEILVYAEFEDSVNIDKYRAIHVLGASEKKPIIQLDETFFMGKYENALGTYMFFKQDPLIQGKDPIFDKYPDKGVRYVCKTRKLLSMEHAYVTPKEGKESNPQSQAKPTEEDVQPVMFRDLQQATDAFKAYFISEPASSNDQNSDNIRTEQNPDNIWIEFTNNKESEDIVIDCTNDQNPINAAKAYNIFKPNSDSVIIKSTIDRTAGISTESTIAQNLKDIGRESTKRKKT